MGVGKLGKNFLVGRVIVKRYRRIRAPLQGGGLRTPITHKRVVDV